MTGGCCITAAGRARRPASWVVPAALLLFTPKCPACLAAYVLAATGVSVSTASAGWARIALIGASIIALLWLAVCVVWRTCRAARARHAVAAT